MKRETYVVSLLSIANSAVIVQGKMHFRICSSLMTGIDFNFSSCNLKKVNQIVVIHFTQDHIQQSKTHSFCLLSNRKRKPGDRTF